MPTDRYCGRTLLARNQGRGSGSGVPRTCRRRGYPTTGASVAVRITVPPWRPALPRPTRSRWLSAGQSAEHDRGLAVDSGVSDRHTELDGAHNRCGDNSNSAGSRLSHRVSWTLCDTAYTPASSVGRGPPRRTDTTSRGGHLPPPLALHFRTGPTSSDFTATLIPEAPVNLDQADEMDDKPIMRWIRNMRPGLTNGSNPPYFPGEIL